MRVLWWCLVGRMKKVMLLILGMMPCRVVFVWRDVWPCALPAHYLPKKAISPMPHTLAYAERVKTTFCFFRF